ncbi:Uncharacterized protein HZ326_8011 [Fusarium oxysporum f. sp. albedinis]|nr:Uncharacterized protein HZ326_8011 [Fusarium oxysporum f. sp. albedinis]
MVNGYYLSTMTWWAFATWWRVNEILQHSVTSEQKLVGLFMLFPEKIYSNCIMIKVLIFREREPRPSFEMDTIRCIYTKLVLVVVSVRHKFKGPRPEFAVLEGRLTS